MRELPLRVGIGEGAIEGIVDLCYLEEDGLVLVDYKTDALGSAAYGPEAALTLLIRSGRPPEYKREMLKRLWQLLQDAMHAPDDQIVIGIQEVPASQAMEMGQIMPEVAEG